MPKTALQNAIIREKRKNNIINSSLKLFAQKGIDNVNIDDIANVLHISHGLFYHYFKDKNDLVNSIVTIAVEKYGKNVSQLMKEDIPELEFINKLTDFYLENITASGLNSYYMFVLLTINVRKILSSNNWVQENFDFFARVIQKGQKEGQIIDLPVEDLITSYYCLLLSFVRLKIKDKEHFKIPSKEVVLNLFCNKGQ